MPVLRLWWYERLHNDAHTFNSGGQLLNITKQTARVRLYGSIVALTRWLYGSLTALYEIQFTFSKIPFPKFNFLFFPPDFILLELLSFYFFF